MKRKPKLTKRERKALDGKGPAGGGAQHIHCVACGVHLDPSEFGGVSPTATSVRCQHGSNFAMIGLVLIILALLLLNIAVFLGIGVEPY